MWYGQKPSRMSESAIAQKAALRLRYTGQSEMCVQGSVTGSVYQFSPTEPVQPVDPRDARFLLGSRLFGLSQ
jgi:hypothetical protein